MRTPASPHQVTFAKKDGVLVGHLVSIEQFVNFVTEYGAKETTLYRGQRRDKPLLPRIARMRPALLRKRGDKAKESKIRLEAERAVLETFKREAVSYLDREPTTLWRWLTIARHHELPTRLLDWSENPLIALWFAVNKPAKKGENGVVWQYIPDSKDYVDDTDAKRHPFKLRKPVVLRPSHFDDRIRTQSSVFTVHNYAVSSRTTTSFEKLAANKSRLRKLIIAPERFPYLRFALDQLGINEAVIFRDLTGLCHRIDWNNSFYEDEEDKFEWSARNEEWVMLPVDARKPSLRRSATGKRPRRGARRGVGNESQIW